MPEAVVYLGDSRVLLPYLADNTIDAIVTDPPYELTDGRSKRGFMGHAWDATGVAFDVALWAECLRVTKPGGHLVAFGATRTWHRLACAIEDAGWEIRDSLHWLFGSGMPKSLNVEKAITKSGGEGGPHAGMGTALKPAHEPIVLARKPLDGTVAANVLAHGTGALNIDATRIATDDRFGGGAKGSSGFVAGYQAGSGWVPGPAGGRWPANVVLTHSPGCAQSGDSWQCALDCPVDRLDAQSGDVGAAAPASGPTFTGPSERGAMSGAFTGMGDRAPSFHGDAGGASRFFHRSIPDNADPFHYCGKAPKSERVQVDGVTHPTQKPLGLMRWLTRLVTPRDGVILDPFAGSGTTLEAAVAEGYHVIGLEQQPEYLPLISARVERVGQQLQVLDGSDVQGA